MEIRCSEFLVQILNCLSTNFTLLWDSQMAQSGCLRVLSPRSLSNNFGGFHSWGLYTEKQGKVFGGGILGRKEYCDLDGSAGKSTYSTADLGSIPELGRSPGEKNGYPLQYSGLENSMDSIVHGVAKSWTRLSNFHFIVILWLWHSWDGLSSTFVSCSLPGMGPGIQYCLVNVEWERLPLSEPPFMSVKWK